MLRLWRQRHYIVLTFAVADIPITRRQAKDLTERNIIYRVSDQPDDGVTSYYVNGYDPEDDRRILVAEGLI